jgi:hypothetical protein
MSSTPVLALNVHAGFECRHSGACCTAGWPIPVEQESASAILASGLPASGAMRTAGDLPEGAAALIMPLPGGACPFFEAGSGRLCAVQRRLGHGALPASCRHFPRVALLEPDAVRVTLSHGCPTAASMLFRADIARLRAVRDAAGIADRTEHDGFDARQTIPPLLRPGVAMDPGACRIWECCLLNLLGSGARVPEGALAGVAESAEAIRNWKPGPMSLEDHTAQVTATEAGAGLPRGRWGMSFTSAARLFETAVRSVPPHLPRPALPDGGDAADRAWVAPYLIEFARPVGRYLAARSFGAWSAYLGEGLRTQVTMLAVALAAVRIEAARATSMARRRLDTLLLISAIRRSDLLLHHLSDPAALVRSLAAVERGTLSEWLTFMGLEEAR